MRSATKVVAYSWPERFRELAFRFRFIIGCGRRVSITSEYRTARPWISRKARERDILREGGVIDLAFVKKKLAEPRDRTALMRLRPIIQNVGRLCALIERLYAKIDGYGKGQIEVGLRAQNHEPNY